MPYESYFNRIHEINHQIVVAKRITKNRMKKERIHNVVDIIGCIVNGIICIGLLYFFIALGGTYR